MLVRFINRSKNLGFSDLQMTVISSSSTEINVYKGKVDKNFLASDTGYTIKGVIDGKCGYLRFQMNKTDYMPNEEIDKLLLKLKDNILSVTSTDVDSIFEGSESYPEVEEHETDYDKYSINDKINLLKEIEKKCYEYDSRIELVNYCEYEEGSESAKILNSKGLNLTEYLKYSVVVVGVVAGSSKEDPNKQSNFEVKFSYKFSEYNVDEIVEKVCSKALAKLGASPVSSKTYPVLMDKDAMSSILAGFVSMFNGESALRKVSGLVGKIGQKIVSEKITIYDDPLCKDAIRQYAFDFEGVASQTKEVVSKGVFKTFLHNLKTANAFNVKPTGNASQNGGISTTNFFIGNGDTSTSNAIKDIKEGLIITDLAGLHAGLNPISGDFSCQSSGFLIENGKISRPVTLVVVSGNFLNMLNEVETVCNDLEISYNGFGSPSILFKGLVISGK